LHIGAFHKRKMTARPLRELERVLGHRVHVEGWVRYDNMPDDVWKFEAFNYLDASTPSWAAYVMLKMLGPLSDWFGMSWQGYNWKASPLTDDPDEDTICAFYWNPPDQHGLPHYRSAGVLLRLVDPRAKPFDRRDRFNRIARPVVSLPAAPQLRADYEVEFTVHIVCGNKQDLMTYHWPRLQQSRWPDGVSHFDVDARTHAGKPNIIRVRKVLPDMCEHDAVAYCLSYAQSFRIKLETGANFRLVGERQPGKKYSDGIVAFALTRAERNSACRPE